MFCNKCGKKTDVNSKFCNYCGTPTNIIYTTRKIQKKKIIYKKWWFWLLVAIELAIILFLFFSTSNNYTYQTSKSENRIDKKIEDKLEETEEEKTARLQAEKNAKVKAEAEEKVKKQTEEKDFKEECEVYTYEQLARNPDKIKGKKVKLTGQVIQVMQGVSSVELRINITKEDYGYYDDTIYALYIPKVGEDKILEEDVITVWGIAQGDYSYTSILGSSITLPFVNIHYVEIK